MTEFEPSEEREGEVGEEVRIAVVEGEVGEGVRIAFVEGEVGEAVRIAVVESESPVSIVIVSSTPPTSSNAYSCGSGDGNLDTEGRMGAAARTSSVWLLDSLSFSNAYTRAGGGR